MAEPDVVGGAGCETVVSVAAGVRAAVVLGVGVAVCDVCLIVLGFVVVGVVVVGVVVIVLGVGAIVLGVGADFLDVGVVVFDAVAMVLGVFDMIVVVVLAAVIAALTAEAASAAVLHFHSSCFDLSLHPLHSSLDFPSHSFLSSLNSLLHL